MSLSNYQSNTHVVSVICISLFTNQKTDTQLYNPIFKLNFESFYKNNANFEITLGEIIW
jgi:hypothetical protein